MNTKYFPDYLFDNMQIPYSVVRNPSISKSDKTVELVEACGPCMPV